jgi:hypothetical protein
LVVFAAAACMSYWFSFVTNFPFGPRVKWMKQRHVDIYAPFTFTGGSGGYWPSLPRLTLFSGEAALPGVVLLIALAYSLMNETGRHRTCFVALLGSGIAFTQSAAAVLALAVLVAVAVTVNLTKHMTLLPAGLFAAGAVFFLERAATAGVHAKIAGNAASVTDRGPAYGCCCSRPASIYEPPLTEKLVFIAPAKAELAKVDVADA